MTVAKTDLPKVSGEVTCAMEAVVSGQGILFLGTNRGIVYKYNIITGTVTEMQRLPGAITAIAFDAATYLYIGTNKGKIYKYTLSSGAISTLYTADKGGIAGLTLYSSTLYGALTGGQPVSITTS